MTWKQLGFWQGMFLKYVCVKRKMQPNHVQKKLIATWVLEWGCCGREQSKARCLMRKWSEEKEAKKDLGGCLLLSCSCFGFCLNNRSTRQKPWTRNTYNERSSTQHIRKARPRHQPTRNPKSLKLQEKCTLTIIGTNNPSKKKINKQLLEPQNMLTSGCLEKNREIDSKTCSDIERTSDR